MICPRPRPMRARQMVHVTHLARMRRGMHARGAAPLTCMHACMHQTGLDRARHRSSGAIGRRAPRFVKLLAAAADHLGLGLHLHVCVCPPTCHQHRRRTHRHRVGTRVAGPRRTRGAGCLPFPAGRGQVVPGTALCEGHVRPAVPHHGRRGLPLPQHYAAGRQPRQV